MTLLKAYLKGDTDPIMLAKAYYEDMLHKSVEAVEKLIAEELTFNMDNDMKEWNQEIKETQDEIKFWKGLVSDLEAANIFGFKTMLQEASREDEYGDIESINLEEVPAYIKELEGHIKNVQANINDAIEEYNGTVKRITDMDVDEFKEGKRKWPEEVYIRIHELGLSYIESKLDSVKERFEILKESGELPQIRPKKLNTIDRKINAQLNRWKKLGRGKRPSYEERQETLRGISETLSVDSPEWRYRYYENLINEWEVKKKRSIKELEEYTTEKEPYVYEISEKKKPEKKETQRMENRLRFSDEDWWKQLSSNAPRVTDSPKVMSLKIFQNALKEFFENFPGTRFDEPVTSNKTVSGVGEKENPNTRLLNLTKLLNLFKELPEQQLDLPAKTIMAGLEAEIEYLEETFERKRDKEGQVPNKAQGKSILKELGTALKGIYESARSYRGGDYSEKFIKNLNRVKRTRLSLRELQTFAKNKVTIKSLVTSDDREVRDRAKFLLDTFDDEWPSFKKVEKILNEPIGKEDNKLIDVISDAWDKENTYKVPERTKEGQSKLNMLLDEALGEFEKVLDEQEGAVVQIADPELEQTIENNLEWLTYMLEEITSMSEDGSLDDEEDEELVSRFGTVLNEFRSKVWEVMRRLNPDDPDYQRIKEIKDKIIDEIRKIPKVSHLVDDFVKARKSNPEYLLNERLDVARDLQDDLKLFDVEGYSGKRFLVGEDGKLDENKAKAWINEMLPLAKSNKGRSKRTRLINKIIKGIEIKEKDVNYDIKNYVQSTRQMMKEIDEEYDEADVGQRQMEEMTEGGQDIYEDEFNIGELSGRYESDRGD